MRQLPRLPFLALWLLAACFLAPPQARAEGSNSAAVAALGEGFVSATASVEGATIHYVRGGSGPALVLVHGFPEDWYEYAAIMPRLAKRFTVVAPDLRGIGGSTVTAGGYDAATRANDIHQLIASLKLDQVYIVGHDLGGLTAYAYLRKYPETLRGAMLLDVPIPGVAGWDEALSNPDTTWHVRFFQVPGLAEKLVADRQADLFGHFFSIGKFRPDEIAHYVQAYADPAQLHAGFEMYRAFPADVAFNAQQRSANDVPLVFGAGEKSPFAALAPTIAEGFRVAGLSRVETGLIPGAGHYVVADNPDAVAEFIERHASPR
jgi:pimeloyl-ACP methyl ester carboxylesterase